MAVAVYVKLLRFNIDYFDVFLTYAYMFFLIFFGLLALVDVCFLVLAAVTIVEIAKTWSSPNTLCFETEKSR